MSISEYNQKRLPDIFIRQQAYIEGVKLHAAGTFQEVIGELIVIMHNELDNIAVNDLSLLSKAELTRFLKRLRNRQSLVYDRYVNKLIDLIEEFLNAVFVQTKEIFGEMIDRRKPPEEAIEDENALLGWLPWLGLAVLRGDGGALWSKVKNMPMPADGQTIEQAIKAWAAAQKQKTLLLIYRAAANGWTKQQVIDAWGGAGGRGVSNVSTSSSRNRNNSSSPSPGPSPGGNRDNKNNAEGDLARKNDSRPHSNSTQPDGTATIVRTAINQLGAALATAMQHAAQVANQNVSSALYEYYYWISVLDSRTTPICRSRSRNKYRYGKGPLPPAHIRCRSSTIPAVSSDSEVPDDEDFFDWIQRQPIEVQEDLLARVAAVQLRSGTALASDFSRYQVIRPISIDEFRAKLGSIMQR